MKKIPLHLLLLLFLGSVSHLLATDRLEEKNRATAPSPAHHYVTAGEYCEFLNAVAADDFHHLYDENQARGWRLQAIGPNTAIPCIVRSGAPGHYCYEVMDGKEKAPINYVSQNAAMCYCDWLQNTASPSTYNFNSCEVAVDCFAGYDQQLQSNRSIFYIVATSTIPRINIWALSTNEQLFIAGLYMAGFVIGTKEAAPHPLEHPREDVLVDVPDDSPLAPYQKIDRTTPPSAIVKGKITIANQTSILIEHAQEFSIRNILHSLIARVTTQQESNKAALTDFITALRAHHGPLIQEYAFSQKEQDHLLVNKDPLTFKKVNTALTKAQEASEAINTYQRQHTDTPQKVTAAMGLAIYAQNKATEAFDLEGVQETLIERSRFENIIRTVIMTIPLATAYGIYMTTGGSYLSVGIYLGMALSPALSLMRTFLQRPLMRNYSPSKALINAGSNILSVAGITTMALPAIIPPISNLLGSVFVLVSLRNLNEPNQPPPSFFFCGMGATIVGFTVGPVIPPPFVGYLLGKDFIPHLRNLKLNVETALETQAEANILHQRAIDTALNDYNETLARVDQWNGEVRRTVIEKQYSSAPHPFMNNDPFGVFQKNQTFLKAATAKDAAEKLPASKILKKNE